MEKCLVAHYRESFRGAKSWSVMVKIRISYSVIFDECMQYIIIVLAIVFPYTWLHHVQCLLNSTVKNQLSADRLLMKIKPKQLKGFL